MPTYQDLAYGTGVAAGRERTRAVFGQVMGLVALTVGCTALGAYVGRNLNYRTGFFLYLLAFACLFGLQFAARAGREQLAIGLLFGLGLLLGIATAPVINYYAQTQPAALWQAAGTTALFCGALGAYGYSTRRDLSRYYRLFFWALIALLVFGIVGLLVAIPHGHVIYCVAGLAIFGGFTVLDFNRLKGANLASAPLLAASIFLDIFNVFLLLLSLFGGGGSRR
ncbi:MAG TPA: Bax inhibitor-1 family protein [Solirubrobacteraceae bacterium]|nr:Bax inhibitor-1 family protein [Solirubrobacteraceae bacterium]